jgi:ribosomal protein S18 acetylase RimI-like enzyme
VTTVLAVKEISTIHFDRVDPLGRDATAAMRSYFTELDARFDAGFDTDAALATVASMSAPHGAFLIARSGGDDVAGCGGIQRHDERTAEVKRMWIAPTWRGAGLGRRLLAELEHVSIELGYGRVVLDTNATLTEAIALYVSAGYTEIERYNDNPDAQRWFAKRLVSA